MAPITIARIFSARTGAGESGSAAVGLGALKCRRSSKVDRRRQRATLIRLAPFRELAKSIEKNIGAALSPFRKLD